MSNTPRLHYVDRERLNLAGLMLGEIISRNLSSPRQARIVRRMKGDVGVTVGQMDFTMRFDGQDITVLPGMEGPCRARVRGSMDAMLQVSLGKGAVRSFLTGDISVGGNPFLLLRILPLIRAAAPTGESDDNK